MLLFCSFHLSSTEISYAILQDEAYTLFMASNNWYIFLRLHAILCERLVKIYERAVILAAEEAKSRTGRKESTAVALRLKPKPQIEVEDYYVAFLDMVKNLLDGNMDSNTYEDTLREMFGIHAYIVFTLDKVRIIHISIIYFTDSGYRHLFVFNVKNRSFTVILFQVVTYAVRQLQHCVTERTAIACTDLFVKEQKRGATGGPCSTAHKRAHLELAYQRAGEKAVQDENCFKIYIYKKDCRMTIELLDTDSEDTKKVDEAKKWSSYKERFSNITNVGGSKARSPVYLNRNLRLYKKRMDRRFHNNKNNAEKKNSVALSSSSAHGDSSSDDQEKRLRTDGEESKDETPSSDDNEKKTCMLEELERKLNDRPPPERKQTEHAGYDVSDETQCKFNLQDSKIMFTVNKDSYLYKISAFSRAKKVRTEFIFT